MKDYKRILKEYGDRNVVVIHHEWGQNVASLYNQIVKAWNGNEVGSMIAILSKKEFGIKSAIKILETKGLNPKIVGKGQGNLRLVEIKKNQNKHLERIDTAETINFTFNHHKYEVNVGDAIFSKTDLDAGTRYLLDQVIKSKVDFNYKNVGDLGSGWGAISLVIANEFPNGRIFAYERDEASVQASKLNLGKHKNVFIKNADLIKDLEISDKEKLDYVISNRPFHVSKNDRETFFSNAKKMLKIGGEIFFVSEESFAAGFKDTAKKFFIIIQDDKNDCYTVFRCAKR